MMTTAKSYSASSSVNEPIPDIDESQKMITSAVIMVENTSTSTPPVPPTRPSEVLKVAKGSIVKIDNKRSQKSVAYSPDVHSHLIKISKGIIL